MPANTIHTSLTRIADLDEHHFKVKPIDLEYWSDGDYILAEISGNADSPLRIELTNGRMVAPMLGDLVIGALGTRLATLEATGSWRNVKKDGVMHMLTGAGLMGKMTSKSYLLPELIELRYQGHLWRDHLKLDMRHFTNAVPIKPFVTPVILLVGTSMSAGKTTSGRIVTHMLVDSGLKVVGGKLTGAGRYRDILALRDAGAASVFDFVDVGLPSTILEGDQFLPLLKQLLTKIQGSNADVAVLEIGASPLEPYNGDLAITAVANNIVFTILSTTDPYAVYGVMESFNLKPDLVSGPATNTIAGRFLIEKLCQVQALNLVDYDTWPTLAQLLSVCLNHKIDIKERDL